MPQRRVDDAKVRKLGADVRQKDADEGWRSALRFAGLAGCRCRDNISMKARDGAAQNNAVNETEDAKEDYTVRGNGSMSEESGGFL